jgi:hypothetical protein
MTIKLRKAAAGETRVLTLGSSAVPALAQGKRHSRRRRTLGHRSFS